MYNSTDVAERIKSLAKIRNVSIKKLLESVGLGFNTMSNMKTSMPKADNLAKIADYLDCSVDYLLGRTDDPGYKKVTASSEDDTVEYVIPKDTPELTPEELKELKDFLRQRRS